MQLFIVPQIQKKGKLIVLKEVSELLSQMRKVLRGKIGDIIAVQERENPTVRYEIQIEQRSDKNLEGRILKEQNLAVQERKISMIVAMPNKWDKAELIVQKLAEIGVNEIVFRPAERSVIKQWNEKKAERLLKIAQEATEQSRGIQIPSISFCQKVEEAVKGMKVYIFDK